MNNPKVIKHIVNWLNSYSKNSKTKGFVIGISGGIDSAVTSTLCSKTGLKTICIEMPIFQSKEELERSKNHISWLKSNFNNVESLHIDLTNSFSELEKTISDSNNPNNYLALANTRSRLRMATLYYYASINNCLVVGTGNKVEDFGVGFYTKYGDGGVDISPIADLYKSEVYFLAESLQIIQPIQDAAPTDGLWNDSRTDEDQIGATYEELEWAMKEVEDEVSPKYSTRQKEVMDIYLKMNKNNQHKMKPIPIFKRKLD